MANTKDGSSNVQCEQFEPFCQLKRLQDSDILEVHLPEFKKEQMRVRITNNSLLTISGECMKAEDEKKIQFHHEIKLSKDIYPDQIRAKFGGGVLSIIMPKKPAPSVTQKTQELSKPKTEASDTTISASKQSTEKDDSKAENLIYGLRSSLLSRLKFGNKTTVAATVVVVAVVALGAYYLIHN